MIFSCGKSPSEIEETQPYNVRSVDQTLRAPFGDLPIRVYYPEAYRGTTYVIHISRGGSGFGDDREQMLSYVYFFVENGFVVIQKDHRNAGSDAEKIARFRGEEIQFLSARITAKAVQYGDFTGEIDVTGQGFLGHSGGCMEGLEAAGTAMTHGNYRAPEITAFFGISPAGFNPDQFGITPAGFAGIGNSAVFLAIGEEEVDINGTGTFMANNWRLQGFPTLSIAGPRFQLLVKGAGTGHNDMNQDNPVILDFNKRRALAFFETYLRKNNHVIELLVSETAGSLRFEVSSKGL